MYVMIDIETIGTQPEAVVLSIGAVCFNKGGIFAKKQWILNLDVQKKAGRTEDQDTLSWWKEQSREARNVFELCEKEGIHPFDWVEDFNEFLLEACTKVNEKFKDIKPVGNGANFDITIIEHLICMFGGKAFIPWKFWNVWCFRTLNHVFKLKDKLPRQGVHHDALDDAIYQAQCMLLFLNRGNK